MKGGVTSHAEMDSTCEAFMAKWGKIPLLDTCWQMAIRQQKKEGPGSLQWWWAERGRVCRRAGTISRLA